MVKNFCEFKNSHIICENQLNIGKKSFTIVQGILPKSLGENSQLLLHFLMHIHVLNVV